MVDIAKRRPSGDGMVRKREDGHWEGRASQIPQFILVSSEVNGYRTEAHAPTEEAKAAVGDTFVVDYVRVFDAI